MTERMVGEGRCLDWQILTDLTDGDQEFQRMLLLTFFETAPPLLEGIRGAMYGDRSADIAYYAHTLKGSCRAIGAISAAHAAYELEVDGRTEQAESLSEHFELLQSSLADLLAEIRLHLDSGC